jgi:hypothetical protein
MKRRLNLWWLLVLGVLLAILPGCGGGGDHVIIAEPGLVEIDDRPTIGLAEPILTIEYTLPGAPGTIIRPPPLLTDQPNDGDIAFAPGLNSFTITQGPDTLFFGIDSADPNRPEYRAFLDFPLDGSTNGPVIPLDATIVSATLTVFVNFVDFAATVPVLLDLVQYPLTGLIPADFSSTPLAVRAFNIFDTDTGLDVVINVTPLMEAAQFRALTDFQVRFLLGP